MKLKLLDFSSNFELYFYEKQDAKPQEIVNLWEANIHDPNFNQPHPAVIISRPDSNFSSPFDYINICWCHRGIVLFFSFYMYSPKTLETVRCKFIELTLA